MTPSEKKTTRKIGQAAKKMAAAFSKCLVDIATRSATCCETLEDLIAATRATLEDLETQYAQECGEA